MERQHINIGKGVDPNALYDLGMELCEKYRALLQQDGVNASGELSKAAIMFDFRWKEDGLHLIFQLPEQWYYVEHGRGPTTGSTGKVWVDPVGDIMAWIDAKGLVPSTRMKGARVPASKKAIDPAKAKRQMAEAIVRKIHREGFYSPGHQGKHPMERAVAAVQMKERLAGILVDAYGREIHVELGEILTVESRKKT